MSQELSATRDEIREKLSDLEAFKKKENSAEYLSKKYISVMATKALMIKRLDQLRAKH